MSYMISSILIIVLISFIITGISFRKILQVDERIRESYREIKKIRDLGSPSTTRQLQYQRILEHRLDLDRPLPPTRGFAASPDFLLLLSERIEEAGARSAIEFGSGVSTLVIARTFQKLGGGHLISIDHDAHWIEETRRLVESYGLSAFVELRLAPLKPLSLNGRDTSWYETSSIPEGPFDFVVVDGPPTSTGPLARLPALPVMHARLTDTATILVDDSDRPDETEMVDRWLREFPDFRAKDGYCEKGCIILERQRASP